MEGGGRPVKLKTRYLLLIICIVGGAAILFYPQFRVLFADESRLKGLTKPRINIQLKEKCGQCHGQFMQLDSKRVSVHRPVETWDCNACHKTEGTGNKKHGELSMDMELLCYTCHQKQALEGVLSAQHRPFREGKCTDCHNPHSSNNSHLLRVDTVQLCTTCHYMRSGSTEHKPYKNSDCTSCHVAHASNNKGLTTLPGRTLCLLCHFKEIDMAMPSQHAPVADGNCTECHVPHVAKADKLLKKDAVSLCTDCHSSLAVSFDVSKHKKTGGCLACHEAHSSSNSPILKAESVLLCQGCHAESARKMKHPVGKNLSDPNGGYLRCASCHNPHGTQYPLFFRALSDELCVGCHTKIKKANE